jgi:hypothetical protein
MADPGYDLVIDPLDEMTTLYGDLLNSSGHNIFLAVSGIVLLCQSIRLRSTGRITANDDSLLRPFRSGRDALQVLLSAAFLSAYELKHSSDSYCYLQLLREIRWISAAWIS